MTDLLVPEGEVWMAAAGLLASRACACVVKAAINRWREHRRQRHVDSREDRIKARENLRDYKPFRGEEYGPPGGYG